MIAMDLDGTLLDSNARTPKKTHGRLRKPRAAESRLCWLRAPGFVARPIADSLPCDLHFIVNNGAVTQSESGVTDLRHLLPAATARKVLEATEEFRSGAAVVFDRPRENQVMMEYQISRIGTIPCADVTCASTANILD